METQLKTKPLNNFFGKLIISTPDLNLEHSPQRIPEMRLNLLRLPKPPKNPLNRSFYRGTSPNGTLHLRFEMKIHCRHSYGNKKKRNK